MVSNFVSGLYLPVSSERLEAYRPIDGCDLEMVINYYWNLCLCESLYPTLSAVEVALRNTIHTAISTQFGDHWFDNQKIVLKDEHKNASKARDKLQKHRRPETPGRIVAELSFGFWVAMLNRPYEERIWSLNKYSLLKTAFPFATNKVRKQWLLRGRFFEINLLRNRVMHYEPVWNQPNLTQQHRNILEAIGWISPVKRDSIQIFDRFPDIYLNGRQRVEADLKNHLGIE
ncbi:Abi family protein [Nitrolancea hollandica]|uniref:Abi-like protein n=1 Tax=Nitrolancea hollandica Lb TaxID=1129897 RepID=I4EFI2_9BACT|nr:Abi family protein [Nitrolancea hollandica]CCF83444.1 conserved hypothetical protein [Nitrolancea hollandica Lb]